MYRPVSLLKATSKVIELIANKKVLNYFEANGLFPNSQHGFRAKRSTFTAVITMHEQWILNKEKKYQQAVAFLDLSAALSIFLLFRVVLFSNFAEKPFEPVQSVEILRICLIDFDGLKENLSDYVKF